MRSILSNIEYWKSLQRRFPPNPFALSGVRNDVRCVLLYQPPVCGVWYQTVGPEGEAFPPITPVHVWLMVMSFSDSRNATANQLKLMSPLGACFQTWKGTLGAFGGGSVPQGYLGSAPPATRTPSTFSPHGELNREPSASQQTELPQPLCFDMKNIKRQDFHLSDKCDFAEPIL